MHPNGYQYTLIIGGALATALFGIFLYREIFPEYKIYQNDYVTLEKFRSTYKNEHPPIFQEGIKQIVFERKDNGPPNIERCVSCHVALDIPYFSPTQIKQDANGNSVLDTKGIPVQIPNEDYIWKKLEDKITALTDPAVLKQLKEEGNIAQASSNIDLAKEYKALKTAHVGDYTYDVTKVLRMHPLLGRETRPFEYHPMTEFGCTSCHNGNGQGLTTEKAHGPVFDDQYDIEFEGPEPKFTESDPANDPIFAREFNHKPGSALVFQTTPIFTGALVQAKCMNCHQSNTPHIPSLEHPIQDTEISFEKTKPDNQAISSKTSDLDDLTTNYHRGQELFISQACYACHRIAGFSRGGVGPELTHEGYSYPWFVKQSIVWPQADLPTSTMPNYHLDHEELQDLVTYLLGQIG